jgi:hypothetical protein
MSSDGLSAEKIIEFGGIYHKVRLSAPQYIRHGLAATGASPARHRSFSAIAGAGKV